jgi:menaquinone-specific isochorismate synthase
MLAPVFHVRSLLATLDARLQRVLHQQTKLGSAPLLSITLAVPEPMSSFPPVLSRQSVFWSKPSEQHFRFALGKNYSFNTHGTDRFHALARCFSNLSKNWMQLDPDDIGLSAQAFVGFSFGHEQPMPAPWQEFPNACLFVPSVLLERKGPICGVTFTWNRSRFRDLDCVRDEWRRQLMKLSSESIDWSPRTESAASLTRIEHSPSNTVWLTKVDNALAAIQSGNLEKLVLTRRIRVEGGRRINPSRLLHWLASQQPACHQFALTTANSTLVGSSPERLVALHRRKVISDAIAGTALRDSNNAQDCVLGKNLLSDRKARREQSLVVDAIMGAMEPVCQTLNVPAIPQLLKLPEVQHLWSPIHGRVKPGVSLFDLASRLHPTPAVGGAPPQHVQSWLEKLGDEKRGWYTGALGWVAANGDGELAVVLRCALLTNRLADLYAGAGIVEGSGSEDELAETEWKLQTMLDALALT